MHKRYLFSTYVYVRSVQNTQTRLLTRIEHTYVYLYVKKNTSRTTGKQPYYDNRVSALLLSAAFCIYDRLWRRLWNLLYFVD